MIKTIIILIATLIIVPIVSFYFGEPLTALQTSILWNSVYICLGVALTCFIISEITRNNSQVDKIWSVVPIVYAWYIAYAGGMSNRLILMAVLVSIWGIRLTYNFSRRGAYTWKFWAGEEDYRWKVLREKPELKGKLRWFFFNLFFISLYQNALILLFTLPILLAVQENPVPLGWIDYVAAGLFLLFVMIEAIADQQQWNYQQEKHRRTKSGEALTEFYQKGFTHTGLWKWMRHPNYMSEQAVWICFYFFSVAATGEWINWSIAGCLLLVILFQGSSDFSEGISITKYPGYTEYKKKTGRFIPKFW
jgi:steroid 5-alpha reductase family enzyme